MWGCRYLFQLLFSLSLDKNPEVELLDCMVVLFLVSTVAAPIYIPTCRAQGFLFSISLPILICLSNSCEVVSHCGFDSHFPDDEWGWSSFHIPVGYLYIVFGKNVYWEKYLLFGFYYWVVWVLYIFWLLTLIRYMICKHFLSFAFSFSWGFLLLCRRISVSHILFLMLVNLRGENSMS